MLPSPSLLHQLYNGTLQSRLNFGKALHAQLSHRLMQDPTFAGTFATLLQAADTLGEYMAAMGMGRQCAACATNNPGGCCSREIAEETDAQIGPARSELELLTGRLLGIQYEVEQLLLAGMK